MLRNSDGDLSMAHTLECIQVSRDSSEFQPTYCRDPQGRSTGDFQARIGCGLAEMGGWVDVCTIDQAVALEMRIMNCLVVSG